MQNALQSGMRHALAFLARQSFELEGVAGYLGHRWVQHHFYAVKDGL
jgi:hypothetical protein